MSDLRTPLGRVKGLGSAKDGTHHYWVQRVSAIALIPLTFWFCLSLAGLTGSSYADIAGWIDSPFNATLLISFLIAGFYHGSLGLQVIIEDYVNHKGVRTLAIIGANLLSFLFGAMAVISVIKISMGGS